MLIYILFSCIKGSLNNLSMQKNSFSFLSQDRKEIAFVDPHKYIKEYKQKKKLYENLEHEDPLKHGQWYYVHFLENNISDIQDYIDIQNSNKLIKNTFILFLFPEQLTKISNISLVKRIEPKEKFNDNGIPIEKCDYLLVYLYQKYKLPILDQHYIIENIINGSLYIIRFEPNKLNSKEFIFKKKQIIKLLSEIPEIKIISTYIKPAQQNAMMTGFTQKNNFNFKYNNKSNFYYTDRYINDNGITGKNQIVTLLDSPIDFYHAMFSDDNVQVKFNSYMPNHRKIIYYNFDGSEHDFLNLMGEGEHGTLTAGIIAGKSNCIDDEKETSFFNGNAPDAKILYAGNLSKIGDIQNLMEKYNSRISSNSWGFFYNINSANAFYGEMAYKSPKSIIIFSNGNYYPLYGNFSTFDPQSSKNILSVGSIDSFYNINDYYIISSLSNPDLYVKAYALQDFDPWYIGSIGTKPNESIVTAIDTDKGIQCDLVNQSKQIIIYGSQDYSWMQNCGENLLSILLIPYDQTSEFKKILESKSIVNITKLISIDEKKRISRAFFSSTGPGNKGILKPDLMAPGASIIAPKSRSHSNTPHGCRNDNERDFILESGTSLSCPNVAGAAALIHDYFSSGRWTYNVSLDSSTTRALLINSCRHPLNSKMPDIIYGHGVVDLSTIIPIEKNFGVQITHQGENEADTKPYVTKNGHTTAKIKVNKSNERDLQITLSYLDPMLNEDSPIPLTRDLDLVVVSPSKQVFLGDHLPNGDFQHASTNEKVIIRSNELEDGEYTIHVYGSNFIDSENQLDIQEFAVVASGPISNGFLEFKDSDECPCLKCNPKQPGFCLCEENNELGPICQAKVETIHDSVGAFYIEPLAITHVRFISSKKIKKLTSKSKNPGRDSTIWISRECHYTLGEYETNGQTTVNGATKEINYGTKEICVAIFNNNDKPANYVIYLSNSSNSKTFIILTIVFAIITLILIILLIYFICLRQNNCICCKKYKKDDTTETTQYSIHEKLIKQ